LPAVFVTKIVGASGVDALLCLGEDNYWYVATDRDLVGIHDLWANYLGKNKTPPLQNLFPPTDFPLKPGQKRHGQDFTAEIAALIPVIPLPNLAELAERQETVAQLELKIANHPIRQVGEPGKLLKRHRRLVELETERQQVIDELNDLLARRWQEFLCLIDVLNEIGGLGELKPTHLGEAAAAIRGDNELWLAIALMSQYLDLLEPQHLAAVICALVSEPPRPDTWVNYEPSGAIMEALDQLRSPRRIVFQLQRRHQVTLPVWMEWDNIGIVENWALGVSWMQLVANTSLDEGDLVRMLRRTLDLLSQIPYVPHISEELRQNARRAIMLMDRFPVKEG
jgi:superfamily II RNA helicase